MKKTVYLKQKKFYTQNTVATTNYKIEIDKLLNEELKLCHKIFEYTEQFESLVDSGELEKANEILKNSIEKTEKIKLIEEKIGLILKENEITVEKLKNEFGGVILEISQLLKKISELDDKVKVLLNRQKDTVLEDLKRLKVGKGVYEKYLSSLKGDNGFIDIVE
ncbi:MAG: hypothetical protein HWN67_21380 [Candidatus Helarchaeota archaeon]|nr:hypothetical protein [Candidatus Helarchaeota archaeon]